MKRALPIFVMSAILMGYFALQFLPQQDSVYQSIDGTTVQKWQNDSDKPFLLLDVRTPSEFSQGHIPGALLIPLSDLQGRVAQSMLPESKDYPIVVYCRSGNRSKTALKLLHEQGYTHLYDLGGIRTWDGPVTR